MHALLITFRSTISLNDLEETFENYARELNKQPGLISKTWILDGDTFGGFHLFANQQQSEGYLASDLAAGLMATQGFTDFAARSYSVLDDLTAMTGSQAANQGGSK